MVLFVCSTTLLHVFCNITTMKQNYKNHKRYYIPHHYVFLPLIGILIIAGIRNSYRDEDNRLLWILFSVLAFCILYLAIMLRQHYALGSQDRIVRLEFRLRYFELFAGSSRAVEQKLSFSQIAALRFADDAEFKILLDRAVAEDLSADEIKKSIRNWQADNMRL
jgi:uncharacterized membrane protein YfcA